jgi:hypothetical protein
MVSWAEQAWLPNPFRNTWVRAPVGVVLTHFTRALADDDVNLAQLHMLSQILTLCPAEDIVLSATAVPPLMIDLMRLLVGTNQDIGQRAIHNLVKFCTLVFVRILKSATIRSFCSRTLRRLHITW